MTNLSQNLLDLGLNENQCKAYLYILENKQINLKSLAEITNLTPTGAKKMLAPMLEQGFIKRMKIEGQKLYMPNPLDNLKKNLIKKHQDALQKTEQALINLEKGFGDYGIKVRHLGENYIEEVKKMIKKAGKAYEFFDTRSIPSSSKPPKEYKKVDFTSIYVGKGYEYSAAKYIDVDQSKNYPQLLAFNDSVVLVTTNEEALLLENQEIANLMKLFIQDIHKKTNNTLNTRVICK